MKPSSLNPAAKVLLIGWSTAYLLYTLLAVWLTTGPHALDNRARPDTLGDSIASGAWILLSVLQLAIAIILNRHYKTWLFWIAIGLATLSASMLIVPSLVLSFTG